MRAGARASTDVPPKRLIGPRRRRRAVTTVVVGNQQWRSRAATPTPRRQVCARSALERRATRPRRPIRRNIMVEIDVVCRALLFGAIVAFAGCAFRVSGVPSDVPDLAANVDGLPPPELGASLD